MKTFGMRRMVLATTLVLALCACLGLRVRHGGEQATAATRSPGRDQPESRGSAARDRLPKASASREAEQKTALDLIERLRGPAQKYPVTRMPYVGEQFPQALLDELAAMNAEQFETVVLAFGKDRTIHSATRTTVVVHMIRAWMNRQENAGRPQLEMVLGTIEELFTEFPPGYDVLPVINVIPAGARWDPEAMAGFITKHWDRWGGPDSRDAENFRQLMLKSARTPEEAQDQMKTLGPPRTLQEGGKAIR